MYVAVEDRLASWLAIIYSDVECLYRRVSPNDRRPGLPKQLVARIQLSGQNNRPDAVLERSMRETT